MAVVGAGGATIGFGLRERTTAQADTANTTAAAAAAKAFHGSCCVASAGAGGDGSRVLVVTGVGAGGWAGTVDSILAVAGWIGRGGVMTSAGGADVVRAVPCVPVACFGGAAGGEVWPFVSA